MLKILSSTSSEFRIAITPRDGRLPVLRIALDGQDYGTVNPAALVAGNTENAVEITVPLPRRPSGPIADLTVVDAETGERAAGAGLRPLAAQRKPRALVIYPAGEIYEHDKVRWYRAPWERLVADYFNIGDMVVFDSTLKLLAFEKVEPLKIMNPTDADIERYASEFDYVFIRGSNFVHETMEWFRAVEVLERVRLPVHVIGVGAQASQKRVIKLSGPAERLWHLVAERCASIGVRGTFTAETLAANGIKNVDIVGCPSIFRTRNRNLKIKVSDPRDIRNVAFSLRREADATYAADINRYLGLQKKALLAVDAQSIMTMTCHGEVEEKAFYLRDVEAMNRARAEFEHSGWWTAEDRVAMEEIYQRKLFSFLDVARYDEFASKIDLAVGYRVHGILPAIAQGVPGVLVSYDTRSEELANTLGVPLVSEETLAEGGWRAAYDVAKLEKLAKSYAGHYDRMRAFLERNGLPHRMAEQAA